MSGFTPGPWEVRSNANWHRVYSGGRDIADILNHEVSDEANARLIAAAPELYEALEALAEAADNFSVSGVYFNEPCMTAEVAALKAAYAALAKARGEQS